MTPTQLLRQLARRLDKPDLADLRGVQDALYGLASEFEEQNVYTIPRFRQVYAMVEKGRVVCPNLACQRLISFGAERNFSPLSSTLRCPFCQHSYVLGMLIWRSPKGGKTRNGGYRGRHPDQDLPIHYAADLRQELHGFAAENAAKPDDPVNRFINNECCCPPFPWRAECPVHGLLQPEPEGT